MPNFVAIGSHYFIVAMAPDKSQIWAHSNFNTCNRLSRLTHLFAKEKQSWMRRNVSKLKSA